MVINCKEKFTVHTLAYNEKLELFENEERFIDFQLNGNY